MCKRSQLALDHSGQLVLAVLGGDVGGRLAVVVHDAGVAASLQQLMAVSHKLTAERL